MTKPQVTRLWIVGIIVAIAGFIIAGISVGLMLAYGGQWVPAATPNNYDFVPQLDGYFWTTVGFSVVGGVVMLAGVVAQLVAWVGAMVNTYPLGDKTWFVILLVGGLIGFAFGLAQLAVMVAYVIAGPDGEAIRRELARPPVPPTPAGPPAEPSPTLVPTR